MVAEDEERGIGIVKGIILPPSGQLEIDLYNETLMALTMPLVACTFEQPGTGLNHTLSYSQVFDKRTWSSSTVQLKD